MTIAHVEGRAWVLRIRDVKESDKGWYMCQVNTDPMRNQIGYLNVVGKDALITTRRCRLSWSLLIGSATRMG